MIYVMRPKSLFGPALWFCLKVLQQCLNCSLKERAPHSTPPPPPHPSPLTKNWVTLTMLNEILLWHFLCRTVKRDRARSTLSRSRSRSLSPSKHREPKFRWLAFSRAQERTMFVSSRSHHLHEVFINAPYCMGRWKTGPPPPPPPPPVCWHTHLKNGTLEAKRGSVHFLFPVNQHFFQCRPGWTETDL